MTLIETLQRRIGGFPIEIPVALLMAGAVGFCTLALPDWRFEGAIAATGLPNVVSAAQPPLGTTARVVVALLLAGLSFAAVWLGLRALDAKPQVTDFPAFRAADLHPDAPRRRPISAGAEFGAPVDALPPIETQIGRSKPVISEPLPSFLAPQPAEIGDFMHGPSQALAAEDAIFEEAAPRAFATPAADVVKLAPQKSVFVPEDHALPSFVPVADQDADGGAEEEEEEESVGDLMARLESGLATRGSKPLPGPSGQAQEELRRALGDLNRTAGRS